MLRIKKVKDLNSESVEKLKGTKDYAKTKIAFLKARLKEYDYIGTKIATGRATKEEYAKEIAQMIAWADEINELENSN